MPMPTFRPDNAARRRPSKRCATRLPRRPAHLGKQQGKTLVAQVCKRVALAQGIGNFAGGLLGLGLVHALDSDAHQGQRTPVPLGQREGLGQVEFKLTLLDR